MSTIKTNTIQPTQAGNNLVFTNGTAVEKMRITDGGLVGIGTASPTVALDVAGAVSTYGDVKLKYPGSFLSLAYNYDDSYRGILGWNTLQLGNNGENRIVAGNSSVGGCLNFFVNNTTPLLTNSTPSNGIMAMSILRDGSLQIGEDGNAFAGVAQPTTITRHLLFAQGSGSVVSGYTGKQTVVGDTWLIGEFLLGAAADNVPMHCEMIVSHHVVNSIETTTYNFGAHYTAPTIQTGSGGWTPWCTLPVTHCTRYNTYQDPHSFRFDVRKKLGGNVQIRMRSQTAGTMYRNIDATSITFRTVASSAVKFVPGATGSYNNSVVATPLNGGSELVGVSAGGYAGRHVYEFPVGDHFKPTVNGLFVNEWGMTHVRSNYSDVFRVESLDPGTNATSVMTWYRNNTPCGYVQMYGSTMTITLSSDHRLKNNVRPLVSALDKICKLNPVSFNWIKGDEPDTGFIAHEVQSVIPNAAFGEKDAVNEDGSILPQSVGSEKLIAWLVAGTKELKAIVEAQAARIAALEGN